MDNILITGGSGFIGSWLCRQPRGLIVQLDRKAYQSGEWKGGRWRYIIHLAPTPIDEVIECAKAGNSTVLFASSGGVYDRHPDEYFTMKIADERALLASGLDCRIARIFTTCGANMQWGRYAIGNFIMQATLGGPIAVHSGGMVVRSYMYGSDLATWLWAILYQGDPGSIYNVGSDEPHNTQELAFEVARHFDPMPEIDVIKKLQYEPRPYYVPDISKTREELDLSLTVPFEAAVRLTVEDYRHEHPGE